MVFFDEDFSFDNEYGMIIPLSFEIDSSNNCTIHCCKEMKAVAEEFDNIFSDKISKEAFIWLDSKLRDFAVSNGYTVYDDDTDDYYLSYRINSSLDLNTSFIDNKTVKLVSDEYFNRTEYDIPSYLNDGLCMYAHIENGEIVSVAAENLFDADTEGVKEISVETLNEFQGRGYGASVVSALCSELLKDADCVYYVTSHKNLPSCALAEKCGFTLEKKFFSYCCYR